MLVIGLTGGIACGKSTVSNRLHSHYKIQIVDADAIARQIMEPGGNAYSRVIKRFSDKVPNLILEDGSINRPALGEWVFANPNELEALNHITHSLIKKKIIYQILKCYFKFNALCILDAPLLFEGGLDVICGVTVSVVCDSNVQLERLLKRNPELSEQHALDRINSQISTKQRILMSDFLIENSGDINELYGNIDGFLKHIRPTFVEVLIEYFPPYGFIAALGVVICRSIKKRWLSNFKTL